MSQEKHNRLTIIGESFRANGHSFVSCVCDCGVAHVARRDHIRSGATKSCGCWNEEVSRIHGVKHGHHRKGAPSAEYRAWCGMKDRCYRETTAMYPHYGGRGITVCDKWRDDFSAFLSDVGTRPSPIHSIDRIDVNGNYEPGNVRWADRKTQARNTRARRTIGAFGLSLTLAEWAERTGIKKGTIWARIRCSGWTPERAVTS